MIIRPIREEDLEQILEIGARMHREGAYSFLPFDRDKVRLFILSYVEDHETQCGLVAEDSQRLIGMFMGYITPYFFCDESVACDMVLFVDEEFRGSPAAQGMIRAFRKWAVDHGASEICLGISTNVDTERTGKFYERMGMSFVGGLYKQRL
ncbi:MAG: GNAT family N-acetyltransferase [bacterium]|nr:GNAT family N-acetyltransferase [bacterium]